MPILHPEVEAAPLGDLRALEAGIAPGAIRTLEDLQRLPYIRGVDLREVWQHHPHDVLCDPDVRIWFATSGTTGAPKGTPYGPPAAAGLPVEYTRPPPPQPAVPLSFLADRRPTAVIGFPSLLLRIAEGIAAEAPQAARAAWRDETSLRTFAGVVAKRMLGLRAGRGPTAAYRPRSLSSTPPPARWASSFSPASPAPSRLCATAPAMSSRCSLSPAAVAAAPTRASAS